MILALTLLAAAVAWILAIALLNAATDPPDVVSHCDCGLPGTHIPPGTAVLYDQDNDAA